MMKGIRFDQIHSYNDLKLVLSNVNISPAPVKTQFIDIPGGDGSVDATEALGGVKYGDREGTFTFTALPQDDFEVVKTHVSNLLNGTRFSRIVVEKDPNYYWTGRCAVNEYASDRNLHQIVVNAVLAPYKLKINMTEKVIPAGENMAGVLTNGRKSTVPTIHATHEFTIIYGGETITKSAGTHTIPDIELKYGDNPVIVTSEGAVTFTYQEGDL